jgi:hypothetical protein
MNLSCHLFGPVSRLLVVLFAMSVAACTKSSTPTNEEQPVLKVEKRKAPLPLPEPKSDGTCGDDFDCFLGKLKNCEAMKATINQSAAMMGQKATFTYDYEIMGKKDKLCEFKRQVVKYQYSLEDSIKKMMKDEGKTDADIAEVEAGAFAALKEKGLDLEVCLGPEDKLATMLEKEQQGSFDSKNAKMCQFPKKPCPDLPALAVGCNISACEGGQWPVTCTDKAGKKETCRFAGTATPGIEVSCKDGMLSFSSSK